MTDTGYLRERGFSDEVISELGLRVEPLGASRYRRYGFKDSAAADAAVLVIPYREGGRTVFERIRLIDQADLERFGGGKYRQPARQALALYDPFQVLAADNEDTVVVLDTVVMFEGEMNAVAAHVAGVEVPLIGLPGQRALTEEMAARLGDVAVVVVWLDAGKNFESSAQRITDLLLGAGVGEVCVVEPSETDANQLLIDLGAEGAGEVINERLDRAAPRWASTDMRVRAARRLVDMTEAMRLASEPTDYVCRPLAARGYLTVLAGRPGEAKSWLMLALADAVDRGAEWVAGYLTGLRCRQGGALVVDAENGPRLMARRFTLMGMDANGVRVADATGIRFPDDIEELESLIELTGPDLVVLDSLRRLAPGAKENDSDEMAPLVGELARVARERDVAIVLIHHRSTKLHSSDMRGSSAILDQADLGFVLERVERDPDKHRRRLRCIKDRIDPEPAAVWLRLTKLAGFVSIEGAEAFESGQATDVEQSDMVPAHEELADRIRGLADQPGDDGWWSPAGLAQAVDSRQQNGTFKKALALLVEAGEWEATGATRRRRYRRVTPGTQVLFQGDGRPEPPADEEGVG